MKILCPKCKKVVPPDQINVATDLAFCPQCNEGFKISESVDQDEVNPDILRKPPGGAWFRQMENRIIVGATTRSIGALFLIPFTCVWAGGSMRGIYGTQIAKWHFDPLMSLFGIPFLIGSIVLCTMSLMFLCGKVEVSIGKISHVFIGIGFLGWKRRFDWLSLKTIREEDRSIVLEGSKLLKFGSGLSENRRCFVLNMLKYLHSQIR